MLNCQNRIQNFWDTELYVRENSGEVNSPLHEICVTVHGFNGSGVHGFNGSGVHGFNGSMVQWFRVDRTKGRQP